MGEPTPEEILSLRFKFRKRDDGDGRVDVFDSGGGVQNTVTIVTTDTAKFREAMRLPFSKGNEHWGNIRRYLGQRPKPSTDGYSPSESANCQRQSAFLM